MYDFVTIQSAASTTLLAACEHDSGGHLDHRAAIFMSKLLVTGQELNSNMISVSVEFSLKAPLEILFGHRVVVQEALNKVTAY